MVHLQVMLVVCGEKNGFWNMKIQQPNKVCFKNLDFRLFDFNKIIKSTFKLILQVFSILILIKICKNSNNLIVQQSKNH